MRRLKEMKNKIKVWIIGWQILWNDDGWWGRMKNKKIWIGKVDLSTSHTLASYLIALLL